MLHEQLKLTWQDSQDSRPAAAARRATKAAASEHTQPTQPQQAAAGTAAAPNAPQAPSVSSQDLPPNSAAAPVPTSEAAATRSPTILVNSGGESDQGAPLSAHTPLRIPAAAAMGGAWPGAATAAVAQRGASAEAGSGMEQTAQCRGHAAAGSVPMGPWVPPAATLERPPAAQREAAAEPAADQATAEAAARAAALREAAVAAAAAAKAAAAAAAAAAEQLQPRRLGFQERKTKRFPNGCAERPSCPAVGEGGGRREVKLPQTTGDGQSQEGCLAGQSSMMFQIEQVLEGIMAADLHKRRRLESRKTLPGTATVAGKWLDRVLARYMHSLSATIYGPSKSVCCPIPPNQLASMASTYVILQTAVLLIIIHPPHAPACASGHLVTLKAYSIIRWYLPEAMSPTGCCRGRASSSRTPVCLSLASRRLFFRPCMSPRTPANLSQAAWGEWRSRGQNAAKGGRRPRGTPRIHRRQVRTPSRRAGPRSG